ncbi:MAG: RNA-binding transcriptional accessory protein [Cyanobacteria bacterium SZAS-4]|nr:RNA-binding transcriptional accessory protein [Cyanobacteria bacterium SZAS-4]
MSNATDNISIVANELSLSAKQVQATADLLNEGGTVPFIARYRKEATNSLDEVQVLAIRDRLIQLDDLDKRREAILKSLEERSLLSDELKTKVIVAKTMVELEDIYLPYRPKRRTKAMAAKEKGLEPLAQEIFDCALDNPRKTAENFISEEKGVASADDALSGARDIIAEWINENQQVRTQARHFWTKKSNIKSTVVSGKDTDAVKFKDYYDWSEPIESAPSHRVLALLRGEKEGLLKVEVGPQSDDLIKQLENFLIKRRNPCAEQIKLALADCYKRLLAPSMETEIRQLYKAKADIEAIKVFSDNIRQLLMAPPLGQVPMLAVDPGFRTGCKLAVLDQQGKLLHHDVIYLHEAEAAKEASSSSAGKKLIELCQKHNIGAIAIGNGTAGRESESFIKKLLLKKSDGSKIPIVMVNESGASIYSASEVAREEFPNLDLTVRGAVSIGRRLMDPLAELVKIEPKSIGVGQYQHDVDQTALQKSLDDAVTSCVNSVGVELNTASKQLLTYVSGLGPQLAGNIVKHREENGAFKSRTELKKVARLGAKAYEQAAGFLRIHDGKNPLDTSAVHPESYSVVDAMAADLGCKVAELLQKEELRRKIDINKYITDKIGLPTLKDIVNELAKPGRDPRDRFEQVEFADGINTINDLKTGMIMDGVVTNVTAFGAFVDIGVHQDGLVHISELADKFVKVPADVVKVQQKVKVKVMSVDADRKRISLSMKNLGAK